jgi:peptidoglycan hydrolase-like protein with peptidoglycan-binding domain
MKSFSFTFLTVVIIGALIAGGYFAIKSLKDPVSYTKNTSNRIGDLHRLETEPQSTVPDPAPVEPVTTTTIPEPEPVEKDLKTNIQTLIDKKITLKIGSKGTNVGYVQEFMNLYFKKNLKIDNDFGKTLEANVKAFQKATGVTQTGQVGPTSLGKMVDWLSKNPQ